VIPLDSNLLSGWIDTQNFRACRCGAAGENVIRLGIQHCFCTRHTTLPVLVSNFVRCIVVVVRAFNCFDQ